jgi:hypothetical protein
MDICVDNLPSDVTGNDLRKIFESFGRVETVDVVKHRHRDESRRFGFVDMPARSEAVCAVLGVHGRNVNGQALTAAEVRPRDPVSGACRTRCHCRSGEQAAPQARMDWTRIIGARSLIQSGFYSAPDIGPVILDRCLTSILLDKTMSDGEGLPVAQDDGKDAFSTRSVEL